MSAPQPPPLDWQRMWEMADHGTGWPDGFTHPPESEHAELMRLRAEIGPQRNRRSAALVWRPGMPRPEGMDVDMTDVERDYQTEVHIAARKQQQAEDARRMRGAQGRQPIVLVPASVVRQRKPPPDLVEGLIPGPPCIGVFFGESGTYKSFLVLNLLLCAGSVPAAFLGHAVNGTGWGVYVLGEGYGDAGLRVHEAIKAHPGFTDERLAYIEQAFPLSDEQAVDEVIARCRELASASGVPVLLVVFDSFADFYGAADNENSAADMQRLIAGMRRISAALGCVVMANAHTGHGGTDEDGSEKPPPSRQRGTSRFRQAWDFELMSAGSVLTPVKNRSGRLASAVRFAMEHSGGSLVVGEGSGPEGEDGAVAQWPHPCPFEAWVKVAEAVRATPGMNLSQIAKVAKVRKEWAGIALMMSEQATMMINTGTKSKPQWEMGGWFYDWWIRGGGPPENEDGSASSLWCVCPMAATPYRGTHARNQFPRPPGTTRNCRNYRVRPGKTGWEPLGNE